MTDIDLTNIDPDTWVEIEAQALCQLYFVIGHYQMPYRFEVGANRLQVLARDLPLIHAIVDEEPELIEGSKKTVARKREKEAAKHDRPAKRIDALREFDARNSWQRYFYETHLRDAKPLISMRVVSIGERYLSPEAKQRFQEKTTEQLLASIAAKENTTEEVLKSLVSLIGEMRTKPEAPETPKKK